MNKELGFAYCGLACCLCTENKDCQGCRKEGCSGKEWCQCFTCCKEKQMKGCWECEKFPCDNHMLNKMKVRTFAKFIQRYGEDKLSECLQRNEEQGVVYHYENGHIGDYDMFEDENKLIEFILYGKSQKVE